MALAEARFFSAYRLTKGTSEGPKGGVNLVIPVSILFSTWEKGGGEIPQVPPPLLKFYWPGRVR